MFGPNGTGYLFPVSVFLMRLYRKALSRKCCAPYGVEKRSLCYRGGNGNRLIFSVNRHEKIGPHWFSQIPASPIYGDSQYSAVGTMHWNILCCCGVLWRMKGRAKYSAPTVFCSPVMQRSSKNQRAAFGSYRPPMALYIWFSYWIVVYFASRAESMDVSAVFRASR